MLGVEEFAPLLFPVHPHRELVHGRPLRHRENVRRLERPIGVVAEGLFERGDRHLIDDVDRDTMVNHRQGRQLHIFGDEQPGRAGLSGCDTNHNQRRECKTQGPHGQTSSGAIEATSGEYATIIRRG